MELLTPEVQEVAESYMAGLDCPRALTVVIMMRYHEWEQLVNLQCSPLQYPTAQDYHRAVSANDFLRKLEATIPGVDPEAAALAKWWEAERDCFKSNRRLYEILDFGTLSGYPVEDWLLEFIKRVRKNVVSLIGEHAPSVFDGRFGPGATVSDPSDRTTVLHKMASIPTLTSSALFYLVPWTGTKWAAACAARGDEVSVVRGNSYFTVPKDAKVSRACAKEASLNAYYQLGLGRVMRKRMKLQGINLDLGQDVHRRVACAASLSGEFCTIDLSSASDTICTALVRLAMSPSWAEALEALRSSHTKVGDRWVRLEKFSSMGNGFTFELETAIFAAICMSCSEDIIPGVNMWVYGDDMIVPTAHAQDVIRALEFFGFTTNSRKTFITGPFRESCGGDFYDGVSVRAHYLKELPHEPQHYIALANGIRRVFTQLGTSSPVHRGLLRAWHKCLDLLPSHIRECRGPESLGDLVIHDDESRWRTRWRANCIRYVKVYRPAAARRVGFNRFGPSVQFAAALYGVVLAPTRYESRLHDQSVMHKWREFDDKRGIPVRNGVEGYKVGWVPFS